MISNKRKTNKNSSSSSTLTTARTKADNITNTRQIPYPYNNNPEEFDFNNSYSESNKNTDEGKMFKIFEKVSPLIDELDTQLSKFKLHPKRIQILSNLISLSLMTSNPVRSLKEVIRHYRSIIGIKKSLVFMVTSKNITQEKAKEVLKTIILTAPYSRNKFNN